MPRANVYIHTSNAKAWDRLPNKSAWVNERLEAGVFSKGPVIVKTKEEAKSVPLTAEPCKHGSDPGFCKFAKPGKPCK